MPLALRAKPHTDSRTPTPITGADFIALYERHFDGVYDFVVRIVRDRDVAADVVQDTFATAWTKLREGHEVKHPKAWLYAIARNRAIDELRRRQRVQLQDPTAGDAPAYAVPDPSRDADPATAAEDRELAELVWSSAAALEPEEYSLLDMHLRRGLQSGEIADVLSLSRGAVHTRLSRLRSSLEESVAATLLARHSGEDCDELEAIVADADGVLTPELRHEIRSHVEACEVCAGSRRRVAAPVAILGALAPIPALVGVRESILAGITGGHTAGAAGAAAGAHHAAHAGPTAKVGAAAAALAAAVAAVVLIISGGGNVGDPSRAGSTSHQVAVASTDPVIRMQWAPGRDADGYAVMFSRVRSAEPPPRVNVRGTSYTSAPLPPGRWWFILRTHGRDGRWTDTLRRGPYVIVTRTAARRAPPSATGRRHRRAARRASQLTAPSVGAATGLTAALQIRRAYAPQQHGATPPHRRHHPGSSPPGGRGPGSGSPGHHGPRPPATTQPTPPTVSPSAPQPAVPNAPPESTPPGTPGGTPPPDAGGGGGGGDGDHGGGDGDDDCGGDGGDDHDRAALAVTGLRASVFLVADVTPPCDRAA